MLNSVSGDALIVLRGAVLQRIQGEGTSGGGAERRTVQCEYFQISYSLPHPFPAFPPY